MLTTISVNTDHQLGQVLATITVYSRYEVPSTVLLYQVLQYCTNYCIIVSSTAIVYQVLYYCTKYCNIVTSTELVYYSRTKLNNKKLFADYADSTFGKCL
uniref:Uncharacterized protein n=1 Tax=Cacopsylla melanoneura TaxID=428564 RepID=A0A8D9ATQ6_9HEMI